MKWQVTGFDSARRQPGSVLLEAESRDQAVEHSRAYGIIDGKPLALGDFCCLCGNPVMLGKFQVVGGEPVCNGCSERAAAAAVQPAAGPMRSSSGRGRGSPRPFATPMELKAVGIAVAVLIALAIILKVTTSASSDDTPAPPPAAAPQEASPISLNGSAQLVGSSGLKITNLESRDWSGVEVHLSCGIFGLWDQSAGTIPAGGSVYLRLYNFVSVSGDRFQPFDMKPRRIWLTAETRDGPGQVDWASSN